MTNSNKRRLFLSSDEGTRLSVSIMFSVGRMTSGTCCNYNIISIKIINLVIIIQFSKTLLQEFYQETSKTNRVANPHANIQVLEWSNLTACTLEALPCS